MANDKKFIVKNGLLTPQNAVIGSTTDTGEKLQVTGTSKLSGPVNVSQSTAATASLDVHNSGGYLNSSVIAKFRGDSDSLQIINTGVGDYKLVNSQQNNGIIFYDSTPGVRILYNNSARLDINSAGNRFYGLSTTTIDGNRILTTADEGSGNGLDADTVDGLEASQFVRSDVDDIMAGNYTIQQDLTVSGNLTVSGTTTTVNTEEILLADNIITLNSNYTGSTPSENSGIEIERGSLDNPKILWDEANDYWKLISGDLTDLGRIITTADEGAGNGFDADTVDGLQAAQFLRSDVDDTANGNITILGDLTIGNNAGGAQIFFDGANNNRTLYSESGVIGFLNQAFNYSAKSDASGNWIVEKDLVAGEDVYAPDNVIAGINVIANTGYVSAATNVTAGGDVIAEGNVVANTGYVQAATTVTAGTDVIGQRFVDADNNSYVVNPAGTSTMNDIGIDDDLFHNGDTNTKLSFGTDDISLQTGGAERLGIDNDSVDATVTVTAPSVGIDTDLFHNGDTDTKISFTTDELKINTGGATRLTANTNGVFVTNLTASGNIVGNNISAVTEVESPIYYDKDDRTYYGDFASTSRVNDISLVGEIIHDGDTNTYINFNAADSFEVYTGGAQRLLVNNTYVLANNQMRSPIYYDSNNTTYYMDPASGGKVAGTWDWTNGTIDNLNNLTFNDPGPNEGIQWKGGSDWRIYESPNDLSTNAGGNLQFVTGSTLRFRIETDGDTHAGRYSYAQQFIDANDNNFYGDFAGTTRVNDISLVGEIIHDGDTNTYIHFNAADSFQVVAGGANIFTANSTTVTVDGDLTVTGTITGDDANFTGDVSANNITAATAMYSPIYYDADNNAYYGDFAGTSVFNRISIDDYVVHNGDTNTYMGFDAADNIVFVTDGTERLEINGTYITSTVDGIFPNLFAARYYDSENATYYTEPAATSRMNDISLVGEIIHDGDTNTYLQFHNADQFRVVTGGAERLEVNNSYVLANNQMRSPIFYDSNNTAYYGDFASTSQMNRIDIDDYIRHRGDTDTYMGFDANDSWGVWTNGARRLTSNSTAFTSALDVRAPRFVDSNDTNYYLDPANASLSATLNGAVRIGSISNNSRWSDNTGNGGIALLSYGDDTATSNPTIAISGAETGGYSLVYLNRIDPSSNPSSNGSRYIHFYYDGTDGSSIRGDSSGNLYQVLKSGTNWGFWTSGYSEALIVDDNANVMVNAGASPTYATMDNTPLVGSITTNKLHVGGSIQLNGNDDAIVFGRGTASFLKDEELGFGWGGGWHMTDATYLRVRNNKTIYSTGDVWANRFYAYNNTAYYLDPDGDSQLNEVHINDWIRHRGDTNTYIGFPSNDRIQLVTNGNLRLDVTNSLITSNLPVKINAGFTALDIQKETNGSGVSIRMTDQSGSATQFGSIEFYHVDNSVTTGAGSAFLFRSTEPVTHFVFGSDSDGGGTTATNHAALLPQVNNTGYVGNSNYRWQYVYGNTGNFSGNITAANMYASRYYDADNNAYYGDFASISRMYGIAIRGDASSTDSGNQIFFWGAGDSTTSAIGFKANGGEFANPTGNGDGYNTYLTMDTVGRGWVFRRGTGGSNFTSAYTSGWILNNGLWQAQASMRAPVFYDSGNTYYYADLASGSRLRGRVDVTGGHGTTSFRTYLEPSENGAGTGISTLQMWNSEPGNTWDWAGFGFNVDNNLNEAGNVPAYYFGRPNTNFGQAYMRFSTDGNWYFYNNPNGTNTRYTTMRLDRTGYVLAYNSSRAPIFYDSDDTNYYVNPNGTSNLNILNVNTINAGSIDTGSIYTDNLNNMPMWAGDIVINGNENTYYPVTWWGGNQDLVTEIEIYRGYSEQAPWDPIGSGVHHGGLTCLLRANFGGWGGSNYDIQFDDFRETYTTIVAEVARFGNNRGFCIWLRGGGTGGAIYHIRVKGRSTGPTVSYSTYDPGGNGTGVSPRNDTPQTLIGKRNQRRFDDVWASRFYDADNSSYYLDPDGTSIIRRLKSNTTGSSSSTRALTIKDESQGEINFGSYPAAWTSALQIQNNDNTDFIWMSPLQNGYNARFRTGGSGLDFYTDGGNNTGTYSGFIGSGYVQGISSIRAPIFYDTNNTGYYVDPAGNSFQASITLQQNPVGQAYAGVSTQPPYYFGQQRGDNDAWKIYGESPSGTNTGALILQSEDDYDSNESIRFRFKRTYGAYDTNDVLQAFYNYVYSPSSFRAPIFYDSNNTNYYGDFAGETRINTLRTAGRVVIGGTFQNNAYNSVSSTRLHFGGGNSDANGNYYIGTNLENYGGNYTKLDLRWHTGIRMGAQAGYGGTRIFNNEDLSTLLFSVGRGDVHTRVENYDFYVMNGNAHARVFYDRNDTNYYVDPNVNSIVHNVEIRNYGLRLARNYTHNGIWFNGGTDQNHVLWNHYYGGPAARGGAGSGGFDGMLWNTYAGLRIRGGSAGAYDIARFSTYSGGSTNSHYVQLYANNVEQLGTRDGYGFAPNQMRSPIYYDSNDTNYYANPNGTTRFWEQRNVYRLHIGDETNLYNGVLQETRRPDLTIKGQYPQLNLMSSEISNGNHGPTLRFVAYDSANASSGNFKHWVIGIAGTNATMLSFGYSPNQTNPHYGIGRGWSSGNNVAIMWLQNDRHVYAENDVRALRFVDRNNTGYYVDPDSRSPLWDLQLRGWYTRTYAHSGSDFPNGTLVRTSIPATATSGASFVLEATGKSYSGDPPFSFTAQGYLYYNTIINHSGQHFGKPGFTTLYMFENGGVLCFWWPRVSCWNSFTVHVRDAGGDDRNLVTSISNSTLPSYSKGVATTMKVTAVYNQNQNTGDMYASRYYDSNNTGYYGDFASTSRMNVIDVNRINYVSGGPAYFYTGAGNLRGYIRATDTNDSHFEFATSGGEDFIFRDGGFGGSWNMIIRGNGDVLTERYHYAQIYYDRNDSGYYLNPNGTSQLRYVLANDWFRAQGGTGFYFQSYGRGMVAPETAGNSYGNVATYGSGRNGWIGWGIGSRHVFMSTGGDNVGVHDNSRGWIWYWNGSRTRFDHGYTEAANSFRAPIFYDSNDTGYYADPNSLTRLNRLYINQRNDNYNVGSLAGTNPVSNWQSLTNINGQFTVAQYNYIPSYSNSPGGVYTYGSVMSWRTANHSFQLYAAHTGDLAYKTQWNNDNYSGWLTPVVYGRNAGSASGKNIYSDIMYDTNNTGYFVDPTGRSRLSSMDYGNGSYYLAGGDWGYRHNTPYGWIQFGPANTSHAHIYTDRSNFYFNVNYMYMNGRFVLNENFWINNKYFGSGGEIYGTVFYDSNDSAFRWDGTATNGSRFRGVHYETMAYMGLPGHTRSSKEYYGARPRITGDTNYWTGAYGWGAVDMNTVGNWGSGFFDSWGNPANQPSGTSHWVGVQAYHYTNGSARYGWQLAGGPIQGLWFRNSWSGFSSWKKIAMFGVNEYNSSFYASIYYDSDDTGYYMNPNGYSRLNETDVNESYTYGWFRNRNSGRGLYNQSTGMHFYSNNGYYKYAGGGWSYGGLVAYRNYESDLRGYTGYWDGAGFGLLNSAGSWQVRIEYGNANMELYRITYMNDARPYIIYDRNDTGYYWDGTNYSRILNGLIIPYSGGGNMYFRRNTHWDSVSGIDLIGGAGEFRMSSNVGNLNLRVDGWIIGYDYIQSLNQMYSTVMYDQNDTGYRIDPNSSSQLRSVYANDWFRPQGCTGVYWQSYGRGIWSPECEGNSYGTIATYGGGRNGWRGYGIGSRWCLMSTGGDNIGIHDNSRTWMYYWDGGYHRFNYGYVQAQGSMRTPIFYDSNDTGYYLDPNSTSDSALRIRGGALHGPNPTWGAYLWVGTNGRPNSWASVCATNGNLHLDCQNGYAMYLNYYSGNVIYATDFRPYIIYDRNNTTYYSDPAGKGRFYRLGIENYNGSTSSGNVTSLEIANNFGTGNAGVAAVSFHCKNYYGMHQHLRHDGYFGIGGWSASTWRWYVYMPSGDMTAAGNVTAYSDIRLKEDIKPVENALDKVLSLNGVLFKWKEDEELKEVVGGIPGSYDYGIIAQEVEKVAPQLVKGSVHESPDGDQYKTVAYDKLTPIIIEAMKEQQELINNQKEVINNQQSQINELKSMVSKLMEKLL